MLPVEPANMVLKLPVGPSRDDPDPLVVYHGSCPDGFAAALAAWRYFQGHSTFLGLDHGDVKSVDQLPSLGGRAVYILDFSFDAELLSAVAQRAAKLVLLDHHQSAAQKLKNFSCSCGVVHFDLNKSGSYLAWEFFFPGTEPPDLVRFVQDRDLWLWRDAQSPAYLAALDMEPFEFVRWDQIARMSAAQQLGFIERGQALAAQFEKIAARIAEAAQVVVFNGVTGLMANAPGMFHSLVGHMLAERSGSFALLWTIDDQGWVKCGLRSVAPFDCIALAESMGGGGHPQACGFRMSRERLPELLNGRLDPSWRLGSAQR